MRVYAAELICSTGVLDFHTFKLALCIHNKLRSHAEMLSWWAFDVTFPRSNPLRSNRSGLNVSNGGSWNPKLTLKVNSLWIKMKGQNFSSQVLSRHTFRILRKKGSDFFDHRGTLKVRKTKYSIDKQRNVKSNVQYSRLSFEWSHTGFYPRTPGKVRTTFCSIMSSFTWKNGSVAFISMVIHYRVSSTDLKVRTTLYSIINSTTWKYSSIACISVVTD